MSKRKLQLLAVDTATESCGAAVICGNSILSEMIVGSGRSHSREILKLIQHVFVASGTRLPDMDGFAVSVGPGSFTGVRIGISVMKGLAAATGKPMVGVSSLDVLAAQAAESTYLICPLMDARKEEVYFSKYHLNDGGLIKKTGEAVAPLRKVLEGISETCLFTGSGASRYKKVILGQLGSNAHFAPPDRQVMRPSTVAFLSLERFKKSEFVNIAAFKPNYIRGSDARKTLQQPPFISKQL